MGGPGSAEPLVSLAEAAAFLRLNGSAALGQALVELGLARTAGLLRSVLTQVLQGR
jgi:hypothetical protein